jgi:cell division septation protein DedD
MNDSLKNFKQFELFPGDNQSNSSNEPSNQSQFSKNRLVLTFENIVVLVMIFVITNVCFYAVGVKKGQKTTRIDFLSEKINEDKVENNVIMFPSVAEKETEVVTIDIATAEAARTQPIVSEDVTKVEVLDVPELNEAIQQYKESAVYTVQVASFKLNQNALKEADELRKYGRETFVRRKGDYSIVCVGKFSQRDEADKFSKTLRSRYKDCIVRRL